MKGSSLYPKSSRTELVGDLGYQLTFSYFDEASVSEWKGCDLRLACDLPNIDLIVLPVRKVRNRLRRNMCLKFSQIKTSAVPVKPFEITRGRDTNIQTSIWFSSYTFGQGLNSGI